MSTALNAEEAEHLTLTPLSERGRFRELVERPDAIDRFGFLGCMSLLKREREETLKEISRIMNEQTAAK